MTMLSSWGTASTIQNIVCVCRVISSYPVKPLFSGKFSVQPENATLMDIHWGQGGQFLVPEAHVHLMAIVGRPGTLGGMKGDWQTS